MGFAFVPVFQGQRLVSSRQMPQGLQIEFASAQVPQRLQMGFAFVQVQQEL